MSLVQQSNPKLTFVFGLVTGIAVFGIIGFALMYSKLKPESVQENLEVLAEETVGDIAQPPSGPQALDPGIKGVTTFADSGDPVCKNEGLPVVYLFSTTWCPHCSWIQPTFDSAVKEFVDEGKIKAYHWEIDINDDTLTIEEETQVPPEHLAIYQKFNPRGSIPTFVFGCKYYRIGNGFEAQDDLAAEEAEFRALVESMID